MENLNKLPELVSNKFTAFGVGNIKENLCSRQVIEIPYYVDPFVYELLSDFERNIFMSISKDSDYIDFNNIEIPDNMLCEYNCSTTFFTVPYEYMKFIRVTEPDYIKIAVYGIENDSKCIHKQINQYSNKNISIPSIDNLELNNELEYVTFKENKYNVIRKDYNDYYILNTNIPYSYYSRIPLIDSTFSYDINLKKFYEGGDMIDNMDTFISRCISEHNDDINNGYPNIYIVINDGNLIPSYRDRDNSDIFLAKLLKLPFIPVSFIVTDAALPLTINKMKKSNISIAETNEICKPYFIFQE